VSFADDTWRPGSFTKNFSWGADVGLLRLYENIRIGFAEKLEPVSRADYRKRVAHLGRSDLIPINFFLFNRPKDGVDHLIVDELVFQAISDKHSPRFDCLALFAFNFSSVGKWRGARPWERRPTLWAQNYISERVAKNFAWDTSRISAKDIEYFLQSSRKFEAKTTEKVSTNLNFLYQIGGIYKFKSPRIARWWVDALFLALDRISADTEIDRNLSNQDQLTSFLQRSKFLELTGPITPEKHFALAHLLKLYNVCGGEDRFKPARVRDLTAALLPAYSWQEPNDDSASGAVHPTNPRILKLIPRSCAKLAEQIGFKVIYGDDIESFDPDTFIKQQTREALEALKRRGVAPKMSADELHKLMRGK